MNRFAVKRTFRRGFTLLEMMVVVLIITILLSVTGPAFQRLTRGNAVDASSRMIAAQLRLARAEAVSRRTYVAVILPGREFVNRDATAIYRYQSFRAAIVDRSGDDFEFVEWIEGTKWTFLPTGAVIPEVDEDAYTEADPPDEDPLPLPSEDITKELLKMTPDGAVEYVIPVDEEGNSLWVIRDENSSVIVDLEYYSPEDEETPVFEPGRCLFPGFSAEDTIEQYLAAVSEMTVRAVIFAPNGRCVQRTYVTFMEGVNVRPDPIPVPEGEVDDEDEAAVEEVPEDEYEDEFPFEGAAKHNIRVLEISPFTGKIKFLF